VGLHCCSRFSPRLGCRSGDCPGMWAACARWPPRTRGSTCSAVAGRSPRPAPPPLSACGLPIHTRTCTHMHRHARTDRRTRGRSGSTLLVAVR
jgi:hypothetical protein